MCNMISLRFKSPTLFTASQACLLNKKIDLKNTKRDIVSTFLESFVCECANFMFLMDPGVILEHHFFFCWFLVLRIH